MAISKVEICGVNTSKLPVLTSEEKETLFERIQSGDLQARELYIKGNLRLVLSVIKRFSASNENADDLFQIGCIGLMKAIDNFDTKLGVKFSTYAVPMILGEIRRYLRDNNSIRVSRSLRDTAYKAIYARENYMKKISHIEEFSKKLLSGYKNPKIKEIRIMGGCIAVEANNPADLTGYQDFAYKNGIFARPFSNIMYAMVPYIITDTELTQVIETMKAWWNKQ